MRDRKIQNWFATLRNGSIVPIVEVWKRLVVPMEQTVRRVGACCPLENLNEPEEGWLGRSAPELLRGHGDISFLSLLTGANRPYVSSGRGDRVL